MARSRGVRRGADRWADGLQRWWLAGGGEMALARDRRRVQVAARSTAAVPARAWGVDRGAWGRRGRRARARRGVTSSEDADRDADGQPGASLVGAIGLSRLLGGECGLGGRRPAAVAATVVGSPEPSGSDTADRSATDRVEVSTSTSSGRPVAASSHSVAVCGRRRVQRHLAGIAGGVDAEGQPATVQLGHPGQRDLLGGPRRSRRVRTGTPPPCGRPPRRSRRRSPRTRSTRRCRGRRPGTSPGRRDVRRR